MDAPHQTEREPAGKSGPGRRPHLPPLFQNERGYSLYEAVVSLAIAALLTTTAFSLRPLLLDGRLTTQVNVLFTDLSYARGEAVKRGRRVALCRSATGSSCSGQARWQDGWIVFVDDNANNQLDAGELLLKTQGALAPGISLRYGETGAISLLAYSATGNMTRDGTFTFCDERGPAKARGIIISYTGRARVSATASDNRPLRCST